MPHHGSATSSSPAFLEALRPDIAVISAGRGNPFGHPVPAVLERYRDIGAAIYRTDQDGAVTVETDGKTVRVRTFKGRRLTLTTHGTGEPRRITTKNTKIHEESPRRIDHEGTKTRRSSSMLRMTFRP